MNLKRYTIILYPTPFSVGLSEFRTGGERKKYRDAKNEVRTERANEILDVKDILIDVVNGEEISAEESATLITNQDLIRRNLKKYIVKQGGMALAQELETARTEEEELAVMLEWLKMNPIKGE